MTLLLAIVIFLTGTTLITADFTNTWAVKVEGGMKEAQEIAQRHSFKVKREVFSNIFEFHHEQVSKRSFVASASKQRRLVEEPKVKWAAQQEWKTRVLYSGFNDDRWSDQWYLNDGDVTMNVQEVWKQGFTGKKVVVAVVDNGFETNHIELAAAFDPEASLDPHDNQKSAAVKTHGTKCAGVIAAAANNSICGVGIAFDALIGDISLIRDEMATDLMEATALSHKPQHIDIYSNSWGPGDAGWQIEEPGASAQKALDNGVTKGRDGLGSIYVFATGNGGMFGDTCGYNGYVNSIETIAISGVNWDGNVPLYAEACAGIMAVAFSRDGFVDGSQIVTAAKGNQCTGDFSATSAAAAMASGVIALSLDANSELSWRDIQHIIALSARPVKAMTGRSSAKVPDFNMNAAGLKASRYFGFGLMDAEKMVEYARQWSTVPEQLKCEIQHLSSWPIDEKNTLSIPLTVPQNDNEDGNCNKIRYLEHVQVEVNLTFTHRGDLEVSLQSPSNTTSELLSPRPIDTLAGNTDLPNWRVMSLHFWGEQAPGVWKLLLRNSKPKTKNQGFLWKWKLILYGTETDPLYNNRHVSIKPKKILEIRRQKPAAAARPTTPRVPARPFPSGCSDRNKYCAGMIKVFGCKEKATFNSCKKSCGACRKPTVKACRDRNKYCAGLIKAFGCKEKATFNSCKKSCGACRKPTVKGPTSRPTTRRVSARPVPSGCSDRNKYCAGLIKAFGCKEKATFNSCKKSCGACRKPTVKGPKSRPTRRIPTTTVPSATTPRHSTSALKQTTAIISQTCSDSNRYCAILINNYGCKDKYTSDNCKKSCGSCTKGPTAPVQSKGRKRSSNLKDTSSDEPQACSDSNRYCSILINNYGCKDKYTSDNCKQSCGSCTEACLDSNRYCAILINNFGCKDKYTSDSCKKSCGSCTKACSDKNKYCAMLINNFGCKDKYTSGNCEKSCGTCSSPTVKVCVDRDVKNCPALVKAFGCEDKATFNTCKETCGSCD